MKQFISTTLIAFIVVFSMNNYVSAQNSTTISGRVTDGSLGDPLAGVNIMVKGKLIGTITDFDGNFNFTSDSAPPLIIQVSYIGFKTVELEITALNSSGSTIFLEEAVQMGQEIVISASRLEENILQSPVSVEKMEILDIQNTASDDYYKGMANLKGVDVNSSSINFQIINTRGFGSNGNTRFVQLIDGMDSQAPGLNFPIGNLNGPTILDVESMELIPGSSSALYGPNAFNGILLVNSKNPFNYQGASAYVKTGVNHVGNADQEPAPMVEFALRYAKVFNNKLAVKGTVSYMKADDWHGTSDFDRNESLNPFSNETSIENISADRLHYMGDEASLNMNILRFSTTYDKNNDGNITRDEFGWDRLATIEDGIFAIGITAWDFAEAGFLPNHVVAAPSYTEESLVDYGAENLKTNLGLFYRLTDRLELSYLFNYGFGTTVFTGAQRYSLQNFAIGQHRLQLRGDNFFFRAYTTREKSGDTYIAEFLAKRINDERFRGDVANYLSEYPLHYLQSIYNQGFSHTDSLPSSVTIENQLTAHLFARQVMESNYPLQEGTPEFEAIKEESLDGVVPLGPKIDDATNMYHLEGQFDFENQITFMDLQLGATFRAFELNSSGAIFDDLERVIVKEFGGYLQGVKKLASDHLKLVGSVRYDKNQNFKGQFSPKIATVWTFGKNHNIRASFQTGFRNPTMQGQYVDLDIISVRFLGGLSQFSEKYKLTENAYTVASVHNFTDNIYATEGDPSTAENVALLVPFTNHNPVKPETVNAIEIGYKSLLGNKLLIDMVYYYNIYQDFITQIQIRKAELYTVSDPVPSSLVGTPNYSTLLFGSALTYLSEDEFEGNTAQIYTNIEREVSAQGLAVGITYSLYKNYRIGANYNWNILNQEDQLAADGFISEFNTPAHKYNITFGNRKITKSLGFNIAYHWQDKFQWQSSFANGEVKSFTTLDAQISYKLKYLKSIVKIGGSNLLNEPYNTSLGGPNIGTIYYLSVTFDQFMN